MAGRVRIAGFTVSADGFGAGPDQSLEAPLGVGGEGLHGWLVGTRTFRGMIGESGGTDGQDERYAAASMAGFGAFILGRNMFGHQRGAWPDDGWRGWWGDDPPYHTPTFVLTHHPHPPIEMDGGTVFHFVTQGIHVALERAREVAGDRDVRILGGVSTLRQYLRAGLVDELHLAVAPVLLGRGEALFPGLDLPSLGFRVVEHVPTDLASHLVLRRGG